MIGPDYWQAFQCGVELWSTFWGDPLVSGGIMMATYALAAYCVARRARALSGAERAVWLAAAVVLAFQVLNTPLDLHGLIWATGRCLANIQDWYAARHAIQRDLLIGLAVVLTVLLVVLGVLLRRDFLANVLLALGICLSVGMTLTKAVNYHHLERLYNYSLGPLAMPEIFELTGILCVLLAAFLKHPARTA